MDDLPVEVIGNILSQLGAARDVVVASATCRKWREAWRTHLYALSFDSNDWPAYHEVLKLLEGSDYCHIQKKDMLSDNSNDVQKYKIRRLEITDKSKGFIELLHQLTVCDSVSDKDFEDRFHELASKGDDHVICVIEDDDTGQIIATGSVFIEKKFVRNCGKAGHIEDVVVDANARGMQLGKKIIEFLIDHARAMGCYKVILDCSTDNKLFYEKCGFKQKEIQMVKYFP